MSSSTPAAFDYLAPDESFHDPLRADAGEPEKARAVVIPFGLEASVSYGGRTAAGPTVEIAWPGLAREEEHPPCPRGALEFR